MESTLTSKVPPPRSKITTLDPATPASWASFFPWRPYARAAAVGSLMIRRTSSPCDGQGVRGRATKQNFVIGWGKTAANGWRVQEVKNGGAAS